GKRHYENYQSAMHERIWAQFAARQYLWGKYIWCMFDFASDVREEGDTKGQNDKGLVTRERIPKDAYYFYKSVWNSEPMVWLTDKRFSGRSRLIPEVKAYSNAGRAELFVNGVSIGEGVHDAQLPTVFVWKNVALAAGDNSVIVRAYFSDGRVMEDCVEWSAE
ncbi:MAG: glycoside hydrolase family 2 protein, partial [Ruminococcaceae bacterium]|nr:glycoside hydrolase family 2 protein [Oscillospiraceae bacterium]